MAKFQNSSENAVFVPERLLLSELQNPDSPGLSPADPRPDEAFHLLGNSEDTLQMVVDKMAGNCARRESLPTVLAQEELFWLCIQRYGADGDSPELHYIVNQWKGAVAACLLQDEIFLFSSIRTKTYVIDSLAAGSGGQSNAFLKSVCAYIDKPEKKWKAFCVRGGASERWRPLYQQVEDIIAIPAANLNGLAGVKRKNTALLSLIPWLGEQKDGGVDSAETIAFGNPIPYLETHQMNRLCEKLQDFRKKHPDSPCVRAVERFCDEIRAHQKDRYASFARRCLEIERELIVALSLRDALKNVLTVRKEMDRYYVLLEDVTLASLDTKGLITAHHPCAYMNGNPLFDGLEREVKGLLQKSACFDYVQKIANNWQLHDDHPAMKAIQRQIWDASILPTKGIEIELKSRYFSENDVKLPEELSFFNYQAVPALERTEDFFSQKIAVFKVTVDKKKTSLYTLPDIPKKWYTVYEEGKTESQEDDDFLEDDGLVEEHAFLPLGAIGAHCLLPGGAYCIVDEPLQRISLDLRRKGNAIEASVAFHVNGIDYTMTHIFDEAHIENIESSPAVGVWPNCRGYEGGQDFWKNYYTYLCYVDPWRTYKAEAHYMEDAARRSKKATSRSQHFGGIFAEHWGILKTPKFPLFVELKCDEGGIGVIPCFSKETYQPRGDGRAVLAVDFGMSGTVGAFVLSGAPRDVQLASYSENSGVQWQFNKEQGALRDPRHFIAEDLGVAQGQNGQGSMFTLVRRFDLGNGMRKRDLSPFFDGNIEFVGSDNAPVYDSKVFAGLKLGRNGRARNAHMELFLKQALEMFYFRCYQAGASSLDVRFAYPLAMNTEDRENLCKKFAEICSEMSTATGMRLTAVRRTSESRAVQTYYRRGVQLNGITNQSVVVTMDIGGGTTDFSLMCNPGAMGTAGNANLERYYSTELAGNVMFAHRIYEKPSLQTLKNRILNGAGASGGSANGVSRYYPRQNEDQAQKQHFCLVVDQKMRREDPDILQMITDVTSSIHHPLVFQICLLFWFATMLYREVVQASGMSWNTELFICVAGNGSRFYRQLDTRTQQGICDTVAVNGMTISVDASVEQKLEVAKGLVMMEANELETVDIRTFEATPTPVSGASANGQGGYSFNNSSIWSEFSGFLMSYTQHFPGDTVIDSFVSDPQKMAWLEAEMQSEVDNLQKLVAYFPTLCDKLGIVP